MFACGFLHAVLTDVALSLLNISDACWVIHFDVPSQLDVFANRLWSLRKYFERYEDKNECVWITNIILESI